MAVIRLFRYDDGVGLSEVLAGQDGGAGPAPTVSGHRKGSSPPSGVSPGG